MSWTDKHHPKMCIVASLLYDIEANLKYYNFPKLLWSFGEGQDVNHTLPLLAIFSGGDNAECLSINLSPSQPQLRANLIISNTRADGLTLK